MAAIPTYLHFNLKTAEVIRLFVISLGEQEVAVTLKCVSVHRWILHGLTDRVRLAEPLNRTARYLVIAL